MTNSFKESAYVSAPTLRRDTPELFSVASEGEKVGSIGVSINPYHNRNRYLRLDLSRYETEWAKPLFERLAYELKHPLQVMASSGDALTADFLLAGGFELKRRCFEMEVSENDMVGVIADRGKQKMQELIDQNQELFSHETAREVQNQPEHTKARFQLIPEEYVQDLAFVCSG